MVVPVGVVAVTVVAVRVVPVGVVTIPVVAVGVVTIPVVAVPVEAVPVIAVPVIAVPVIAVPVIAVPVVAVLVVSVLVVAVLVVHRLGSHLAVLLAIGVGVALPVVAVGVVTIPVVAVTVVAVLVVAVRVVPVGVVTVTVVAVGVVTVTVVAVAVVTVTVVAVLAVTVPVVALTVVAVTVVAVGVVTVLVVLPDVALPVIAVPVATGAVVAALVVPVAVVAGLVVSVAVVPVGVVSVLVVSVAVVPIGVVAVLVVAVLVVAVLVVRQLLTGDALTSRVLAVATLTVVAVGVVALTVIAVAVVALTVVAVGVVPVPVVALTVEAPLVVARPVVLGEPVTRDPLGHALAGRVGRAHMRLVLTDVGVGVVAGLAEVLGDLRAVAVADDDAVADRVLHALLGHRGRGAVLGQVGVGGVALGRDAHPAMLTLDHAGRLGLFGTAHDGLARHRLATTGGRSGRGRLVVAVVVGLRTHVTVLDALLDDLAVLLALGHPVVVHLHPVGGHPNRLGRLEHGVLDGLGLLGGQVGGRTGVGDGRADVAVGEVHIAQFAMDVPLRIGGVLVRRTGVPEEAVEDCGDRGCCAHRSVSFMCLVILWYGPVGSLCSVTRTIPTLTMWTRQHIGDTPYSHRGTSGIAAAWALLTHRYLTKARDPVSEKRPGTG